MIALRPRLTHGPIPTRRSSPASIRLDLWITLLLRLRWSELAILRPTRPAAFLVSIYRLEPAPAHFLLMTAPPGRQSPPETIPPARIMKLSAADPIMRRFRPRPPRHTQTRFIIALKTESKMPNVPVVMMAE